MSRTQVRVHFTQGEAIRFLPSIVGLLNFYGFHVKDGKEAISCVEWLCQKANAQEIEDEMTRDFCKFCKGERPA